MEMVLRCMRSCQNREIKIYLYTHLMLFPFTLALTLTLALSHSAALQQAAQGWIKLPRHLPVIGTVHNTAADTHPPKHQKVGNSTINAQPETQCSGHATWPTEWVKQTQ